jgi:TonB family protein
MKRARFYLVVFAILTNVILAHVIVWAQQPGNGSSDTLAFENGSIANNMYSNDCFGFSLPLPAGWQLNPKVVGPDGKAKHAAGQLILLLLDKEGSSGNRIILTARDASGSAPAPEEFVSKSVHSQVDSDLEHRQIVKDTYSVDFGGKTFSRADYKQTTSSGATSYAAFVYTKFRGYYLGETVMAGSSEQLDQSANSLQQISFREDEPNSKCVMAGDSGAVIGGIVRSKPNATQPDLAQAQRVRLSSGVSTGLLIKKIPPDYPDVAKQTGVQGQVVLKADIDKNGEIEDLTLVSGHPLLVPAAIKAVKKWKYRPYTLNGAPVAVETEVIVNFTLSSPR